MLQLCWCREARRLGGFECLFAVGECLFCVHALPRQKGPIRPRGLLLDLALRARAKTGAFRYTPDSFPRPQLPLHVTVRPPLLKKFKKWERENYRQKAKEPVARTTRSSATPVLDKLDDKDAWDFLKLEKSWRYHKYDYVVAPEDGAEPVEQARVSPRGRAYLCTPCPSRAPPVPPCYVGSLRLCSSMGFGVLW